MDTLGTIILLLVLMVSGIKSGKLYYVGVNIIIIIITTDIFIDVMHKKMNLELSAHVGVSW